LPKGVASHPIFGQGGGSLGRSGVDEPPQSALGVVRPPPKGQKKKRKKVRGLGGGRVTSKGLATSRLGVWGGRNHPQAFRGCLAIPKTQTFIFYFFGLLEVAGPPPKPIEVDDPHQIGQGGGWATPQTPNFFFFLYYLASGHPLGQKWGGRPPLFFLGFYILGF
jgi:hypothetical protein